MVNVNTMYRGCILLIAGIELHATLLVMPLRDFDVILGMDWLSEHHAKLDCFTKEIVLQPSDHMCIVFKGEKENLPVCTISASREFKMIKKGCEAYLAHVVDTRFSGLKLDDIPVVKEYPDVFSDDLPGLPPNRDIEFTIELKPGTEPISIPPYRMAPIELQELKTQLHDLH